VVVPIERVLAPNPGPFTLEGTNTWLVGDGPVAIIDPGPDLPSHRDGVLDAVARIGEVQCILLTHHHPDHAPGAAAIAERMDVPILAHTPRAGERPLAPGATVRVGGAGLVPVHTPGHTADHLAFHDPQSGALFTGDAVLGRGTSVIDPPEGDLGAYLASLRAMLELAPTTIYPGHGPTVEDAQGLLRQYLAHREERERQILAAVRDGARTPEDVVPVVYVGYPADLYPAAARSVLAHLLELEARGAVARDPLGRFGPGEGPTRTP
jgi:glyoxylase-like metal-dependent hydrolase (beta-lactamase superfamily II)